MPRRWSPVFDDGKHSSSNESRSNRIPIFFHQVMLRPQEAQVFSGFVERDTERGMKEAVRNARKKIPDSQRMFDRSA